MDTGAHSQRGGNGLHPTPAQRGRAGGSVRTNALPVPFPPARPRTPHPNAYIVVTQRLSCCTAVILYERHSLGWRRSSKLQNPKWSSSTMAVRAHCAPPCTRTHARTQRTHTPRLKPAQAFHGDTAPVTRVEHGVRGVVSVGCPGGGATVDNGRWRSTRSREVGA
jgi:hypothetical protein